MTTLRYHDEHVAAVRDGTKRQTIRRRGKVPAVGEPITHIDRHGKPIREGDHCRALRSLVILGNHEWLLEGLHIGIDARNAIARNDGFTDYLAAAKYLRRIYGLPLDGQIISW